MGGVLENNRRLLGEVELQHSRPDGHFAKRGLGLRDDDRVRIGVNGLMVILRAQGLQQVVGCAFRRQRLLAVGVMVLQAALVAADAFFKFFKAFLKGAVSVPTLAMGRQEHPGGEMGRHVAVEKVAFLGECYGRFGAAIEIFMDAVFEFSRHVGLQGVA